MARKNVSFWEVAFWGLVIMLLAIPAIVWGDEYRDEISDYPHPLVCKPIIKTEAGTVIAPREQWIIIPWAAFSELTEDQVLFILKERTLGIPMEGYICDHG